MRHATLKDINIRWPYWLFVAGFAAFATTALVFGVLDETEKDIGTFYVATVMFYGIAICGLLWPYLRTRERQGAMVEHVRTAELNCEALLLPTSRAKHHITLVGATLMGGSTLCLLFFTNNGEYRVKGLIAVVAFAVIVGKLMKNSFGPRQGILLRHDGLVWRDPFRAPYFISWEILSSPVLFGKPQQYTAPSPAIGIKVTAPERVQTSKGSRAKMLRDFKRDGVHLHFYAETLLVPLPVAAMVIDFYLRNPASRSELKTVGGLSRVDQLCRELDAAATMLKRPVPL